MPIGSTEDDFSPGGHDLPFCPASYIDDWDGPASGALYQLSLEAAMSKFERDSKRMELESISLRLEDLKSRDEARDGEIVRATDKRRILSTELLDLSHVARVREARVSAVRAELMMRAGAARCAGNQYEEEYPLP